MRRGFQIKGDEILRNKTKRYLTVTLILAMAFLLIKSANEMAQASEAMGESNHVEQERKEGESAPVAMIEDTLVAPDGLYFSKAQFSHRISPHGDCIDVVNGYVYVTWYRGGMEDRHVMLSRMKIGTGVWKTIEFPHVHCMYRRYPTKGDAHNVISVGVSPIDDTVHLLYDMHAYSKAEKPSTFFNYRVSKPGIATAPDVEWVLDSFLPKRNYLKKGENYERFTYPTFSRSDAGELIVDGRLGGSGAGNRVFASYDGSAWSENRTFSIGILPGTDDWSVYGGMKFIQGKLRLGAAIRKNIRTVPINEGLFYAYSNHPQGQDNWFNASDTLLNLPINNAEIIKIGEPTAVGVGNRITAWPAWTVTDDGSIHFITSVSGKGVHYFKRREASQFTHAKNTPFGYLYPMGDKVLLVTLENDRPVIYSTPAGRNQWTVECKAESGRRYTHGRSAIDGQYLYYYLMEDAPGDSRPLRVLRFGL